MKLTIGILGVVIFVFAGIVLGWRRLQRSKDPLSVPGRPPCYNDQFFVISGLLGFLFSITSSLCVGFGFGYLYGILCLLGCIFLPFVLKPLFRRIELKIFSKLLGMDCAKVEKDMKKHQKEQMTPKRDLNSFLMK